MPLRMGQLTEAHEHFHYFLFEAYGGQKEWYCSDLTFNQCDVKSPKKIHTFHGQSWLVHRKFISFVAKNINELDDYPLVN